MPGGSGRAAFVEDAADGSGTDDESDDEGQDQYDLEDAFIDNSEDVSDEEGMHAAFQHLQLGLAPPDVGLGGEGSIDDSCDEENGGIDLPPNGAVLNRCLPILLRASRSAQRDQTPSSYSPSNNA